MNRESNRIKDASKKRVLDDDTRTRRLKKALGALEVDNYHDDPHADLGNIILFNLIIIFHSFMFTNNSVIFAMYKTCNLLLCYSYE